MGTHQALRERWQREQRLRARLRLAGVRLEAAEVERVWAVVSAHRQGLSIRAIAAAVGLSRARVHQLLGAPAAADIPARLNALRERGWPIAPPRMRHRRRGPATRAAASGPSRPGWPRRRGRCATSSTGWSGSTEANRWWSTCSRRRTAGATMPPSTAPASCGCCGASRRDLDELSRVPRAGAAPPRPPSTDPAEHRRRWPSLRPPRRG